MPRTIEHKIKLLDRPATPPASPTDSVTVDFGGPLEYGTIDSRRGGGREQQQQRNNNFPSLPEEKESGGGGSKRGDWPQMGNSRSSSTQMGRGVAPEKPARKYHYQAKQQDDEVTYGTETFERNLRYSPNEIERQHFSSRSFGEQRSLGGDGESRASVRFEDEGPIRPIDPAYDNPNPFGHRTHRSMDADEDGGEWKTAGGRGLGEGGDGEREGVRLLHRSKHLDTSPLRIPRPKLNGGDSPNQLGLNRPFKSNGNSSQIHRQFSQRPVRVLPPPLSFTDSSAQSPTAAAVAEQRPSRSSWRTKTTSPSSGIGHSEAKSSSSPERERTVVVKREKAEAEEGGGKGSSGYWAPSLPMKKVIRKSRWVSIHDGRPMSNFVETVHYEPAYGTGTIFGHHGPGHPSTLHRRAAAAHIGPPAELWSSSSSCSFSSVDEAEIEGGNWATKNRTVEEVNNNRRLGRHPQESTNQHSARRSQSTVYVTQNPVYSIAL